MKSDFLFLVLMIIGLSAIGQTYTNKKWQNTEGAIGSINRTSSAVDSDKNLVVVSNILNAQNNTDVHVIKYDSNGNILWQVTFNGSGNGDDFGVQLAIDNSNSIFVTAAIQGLTSIDIGLLKYTTNGQLEWSSSWDGIYGGTDIPADIDVDDSGNIYIAGGTQDSAIYSDYVIAKYNQNGDLQWSSTYDYVGLHDAATSIKANNNYVVVTGGSASSLANWDYVTIKLSSQNGSYSEVNRVEVAGLGLDNAIAVTTDSENNIYVTGSVELNNSKHIQTIKINESFVLDWVRTYNGGIEDVPKAIGVDSYGNVYITGDSKDNNGNFRFVTIKYDHVGNEVWQKKYGNANDLESANATCLSITSSGEVVITGTVVKNGQKDIATIKYSKFGKLMFSELLDFQNGEDEGHTVSVKGNDIYVTGSSTIDGQKKTISVVYSQDVRELTSVIDELGHKHVSNQLIIRFDESRVNMEAVSTKDITFGTLANFVKAEALITFSNAIGFECKDLKTFKVFRNITPETSYSITRLGDSIAVPAFWATFIVEFPNGLSQSLIDSANSIYPIIHYANKDYIGHIHEVPNDEFYAAEQLSLRGIDVGGINVENAWDIEVGSTHTRVGVFDSPVLWKHEDFGDGTLSGIDGSKISDGYDYYNDVSFWDSPDIDESSHGTAVAGVIGALRNNGIGIAGIAGGDMENGNSGCDLLTFGIGTYVPVFQSEIIEVIHSKAAPAIINGALWNPDTQLGYNLDIQNHSWGSNVNSNILSDAIDFCWRNHCIFVASRGNDGNDVLQYPACHSDATVINVIASGDNSEYKHDLNGPDFYWMSSYGGEADFIAPGTTGTILTTQNRNTPFNYSFACDFVENDNYSCFNGTSASAPHVAGVAALMHSRHNVINGAPNNLSTEDIENILQKTAIDIVGQSSNDQWYYEEGYDERNGWGLVNASGALKEVDLSNKYVKHTSTLEPNYVQQTDNDQVVLLSGAYGLAAGSYLVDRYQVSWNYVEILPPSHEIIDWWKLEASTNRGVSAANPNSLNPFETIIETVAVGSNVAVFNVTTFTYFIEESSSGQQINQWIPASPSDLKYTWSLHVKGNTALVVDEEVENLDFFEVYPNPTSGIINLTITCENCSETELTIYDSIGRLVVKQRIKNLVRGQNNITLNLNYLANGIYHISLSADDMINSKTLIIK